MRCHRESYRRCVTNTSSAAFLVLVAVMGATVGPRILLSAYAWAAFPAAVLVAASFSSMMLCLTTFVRNRSDLDLVIAWNQPMLKQGKDYVFGLSASKAHLLIAPYECDRWQVRHTRRVSAAMFNAAFRRAGQGKSGPPDLWADG